jgi:hypothetical protein
MCRRFFFSLFLVLLVFVSGSVGGASVNVKPYKVLVVIGDQWGDPGSYNISGKSRFGGTTSRLSGEEFRDVISMLKIWGIPFDILRLDQQRLQINRFLNGIIQPNYSCVIWMADPYKLEGFSANYETMRRVVEDYGISVIALFDYIKTPELANLAGIDYEGMAVAGAKAEKDKFSISQEHFITAGLAGTVIPGEVDPNIGTVRCKAKAGTKVLGKVGEYPQLVVRDVNEETKVIWIGGGRDWFRKYPVMRKIFRKALVYSIGYGVFNDNFENAMVLVMDDIGASEHAYSMQWHYPTPSKETLIKYLIEPLEEYGFIMVQNVTPGYADPVTRMVEVPWTIKKFTDPFGNVQDYGSTKEGLDEGLRRGVFEIQSHRAWTHVNWDLDSPPGPWWDGPIEGEMSHPDWYQETIDERRGKPVPANDMLFIYKVGRDAVEKQFGVTPLAVTCRPGEDIYRDYGRLAAIAGYGVSRQHYIGHDYAIQFSMMNPEIVGCHDIDLAEKTDSEMLDEYWKYRPWTESMISALRSAKVVGTKAPGLDFRGGREWIESRKNKRWMGFNEYCAYVHSGVDVCPKNGLVVKFDYDGHYCRYFEKKPSSWTLELSEGCLKKLGKKASVYIDGKAEKLSLSGQQTITIPAGVGTHKVEIKSE